MGAKKNNISQIDKYLKGQLDAKAMHRLEREAQDDPFLMDALEGFENAATDQHHNLADLEARLQHRAAKNKTRSVLLWRVLPIAACLLLTLGGGYWFINRQPDKMQYANVVAPAANTAKTETLKAPSPQKEITGKVATIAVPKKTTAAPAKPKADKIDYVASNIVIKENTTVDQLLKKMDGLEVDSNGVITNKGAAVAAMRTNGKTFNSGNVDEALKNIPPNVLKEVTIIDNDLAYNNTATANKKATYGNIAPPPAKPTFTLGDKAQNRSVQEVNQLLQSKTGASYNTFGAVSQNPAIPAGKRVVSGMILDAQTKEPLTGATIGTQAGGGLTQADINGKYTVVVDENAVLTYNLLSYASQAHKIAPGENTVNINLSTDSRSVNDVVIRGYVKRDREQDAAAKYAITQKDMPNYPIANVEQLLQGKVAGINVQNNTGAPGMRGSVNIRGLSTDTANIAPLYWVMGVVTDSKTQAPIVGATLNQGGGVTMQTKTDGSFAFLNIGKSMLTLTMPGYLPKQFKIDEKVTLKITLDKDNTPKQDTANCKENLKFKARFFDNIAIAEKYSDEMRERGTSSITNEQFLTALKFIARYTLVSVRTDIKDAKVYYGRKNFIAEKQMWLAWYEAHKCQNLK